METIKPKIYRKSKFNAWIRTIAVILLFAFLWQDIVWAYPDIADIKRATLAQETLATGADRALSFQRFAVTYINNAIFDSRDSATLFTVEDALPYLNIAASRQGLAKPIVENSIHDGQIRIIFSSGDEILFYNPKIQGITLEESATKRIVADLDINDYLRMQFLEERESSTEEGTLREAKPATSEKPREVETQPVSSQPPESPKPQLATEYKFLSVALGTAIIYLIDLLMPSISLQRGWLGLFLALTISCATFLPGWGIHAFGHWIGGDFDKINVKEMYVGPTASAALFIYALAGTALSYSSDINLSITGINIPLFIVLASASANFFVHMFADESALFGGWPFMRRKPASRTHTFPSPVITNLIADLYRRNRLIEAVSPLLGENRAQLLSDTINKRSTIPEEGPIPPHYYLDNGYFYRGQKKGIDSCIVKGTVAKGDIDEEEAIYVSKDFEDVIKYGGLDETDEREWGIFIYPSWFFNGAVNKGDASAGLIRSDNNRSHIVPWPHFKRQLSVAPAKFLIVDRRKKDEYEAILSGKRRGLKGLRHRLKKLIDDGLEVISLPDSDGPYFDPHFQDKIEELLSDKNIPPHNRLLTHPEEGGRIEDLRKIVLWILLSPEMAGLKEVLEDKLEELRKEAKPSSNNGTTKRLLSLFIALTSLTLFTGWTGDPINIIRGPLFLILGLIMAHPVAAAIMAYVLASIFFSISSGKLDFRKKTSIFNSFRKIRRNKMRTLTIFFITASVLGYLITGDPAFAVCCLLGLAHSLESSQSEEGEPGIPDRPTATTYGPKKEHDTSPLRGYVRGGPAEPLPDKSHIINEYLRKYPKMERFKEELETIVDKSGIHGKYIFEHGFPAVHCHIFTEKYMLAKEEDVLYYGNALIEMAGAAGGKAQYLFEQGLKAITADRYEDDAIAQYDIEPFLRLTKLTGENAGDLFIHSMPPIKDFIELYGWEPLFEMAEAAGEKAYPFICYGLRQTRNIIVDCCDDTVELEPFVRMAQATGEGAYKLFEEGIPAVDRYIRDFGIEP